MGIDEKEVKKIYNGKMAKRYDASMSHFFAGFKKKAFGVSSLKEGDRVLVFCCGTGLDFPYIQQLIGPTGSIIGIDFSEQMLNNASNMVARYGWKNVELIQDDVTIFKKTFENAFDVGICTLGLSIIPDFTSVYNNLLAMVKKDGELIIGDMKLATGWQARFNPLTVYLAKRYGGTYKGHNNSLEIIATMKQDLTDIKHQEFFMGAYYYCIGKKSV